MRDKEAGVDGGMRVDGEVGINGDVEEEWAPGEESAGESALVGEGGYTEVLEGEALRPNSFLT